MDVVGVAFGRRVEVGVLLRVVCGSGSGGNASCDIRARREKESLGKHELRGGLERIISSSSDLGTTTVLSDPTV